jgi:hypothetical protein
MKKPAQIKEQANLWLAIMPPDFIGLFQARGAKR